MTGAELIHSAMELRSHGFRHEFSQGLSFIR